MRLVCIIYVMLTMNAMMILVLSCMMLMMITMLLCYDVENHFDVIGAIMRFENNINIVDAIVRELLYI